jgi:glycosyltransferase involved in cell wall biosynthesis
MKSKKKILIVGPFPPPNNGNRLATSAVYSCLKKICAVKKIDIAKRKYNPNLIIRFAEISWHLLKFSCCQKKFNSIYISISQSLLGNLRDILFFYAAGKNIRNVYVHLTGGASFLQTDSLLQKIVKNIYLKQLKKIKIIFVEGLYSKTKIDKRLIHKVRIVKNFSEPKNFISKQEFEKKYRTLNTCKILFLSNLLENKGFLELITAFSRLPISIKQNLQLVIAGGFPCTKTKEFILDRAKSEMNLFVKGPVCGQEKIRLLKESHIFCLPTFYKYEGQPFSIIEGYSAGCAVLTTNHGGIKDIFSHKVNGLFVKKRSVIDLQKSILYMYNNKKKMRKFASNNLQLANQKYTKKIFSDKIIMEFFEE